MCLLKTLNMMRMILCIKVSAVALMLLNTFKLTSARAQGTGREVLEKALRHEKYDFEIGYKIMSQNFPFTLNVKVKHTSRVTTQSQPARESAQWDVVVALKEEADILM